MRKLAWSFAVLTAMTFVLVVFGAVVRAKGAGLACPDWPLCFGELVPTMDFGVVLEWGHRTLAGFVSLGFLGLGIASLVRRDSRERVGKLLLASAVVLVVQIILGGLTVLELLASWTVTSHLICGNAFALSLALVSARLFRDDTAPREAISGNQRWAALGFAGLLFAQLVMGGLVASNFAGMACVEWPTCVGGQWFPTWTGPVGLHLVHRVLAYAMLVAAVGLVWLSAAGALANKSKLLLGLVSLQACVGIANVLGRLPVEVTALHSALACGLVLTTALLVEDAFNRPVHRQLHPAEVTS